MSIPRLSVLATIEDANYKYYGEPVCPLIKP